MNTHAVRDGKKHLKRYIKNAESTWRDVQMTVTVVEKGRDKFPHISTSELYDRKMLVSTCQERIMRAKNDMSSNPVKSKLLQDERNKSLRQSQQQGAANTTTNGRSNHHHVADQEENERIAYSVARASLLMRHQDDTLGELDEAVVRVGHMASAIHEELGMQDLMLDEMGEDLNDAEEKLGVVMGKLAKLLKTKDKCQLGTILGLLLTVIVLLFLVIYT